MPPTRPRSTGKPHGEGGVRIPARSRKAGLQPSAESRLGRPGAQRAGDDGGWSRERCLQAPGWGKALLALPECARGVGDAGGGEPFGVLLLRAQRGEGPPCRPIGRCPQRVALPGAQPRNGGTLAPTGCRTSGADRLTFADEQSSPVSPRISRYSFSDRETSSRIRMCPPRKAMVNPTYRYALPGRTCSSEVRSACGNCHYGDGQYKTGASPQGRTTCAGRSGTGC